MKRMLLPALLLIPALLAPAHAFAASVPPATGTWKIIGDVQGTAVLMTCALVEDDHKLTGTCAGDDDKKDHPVTGTIKDMALAWQFDTQYGGQPDYRQVDRGHGRRWRQDERQPVRCRHGRVR